MGLLKKSTNKTYSLILKLFTYKKGTIEQFSQFSYYRAHAPKNVVTRIHAPLMSMLLAVC